MLPVILLATYSYPAVALYSEQVNNPSLAKPPYKFCRSLPKLRLTFLVRQATSLLCNTKHMVHLTLWGMGICWGYY